METKKPMIPFQGVMFKRSSNPAKKLASAVAQNVLGSGGATASKATATTTNPGNQTTGLAWEKRFYIITQDGIMRGYKLDNKLLGAAVAAPNGTGTKSKNETDLPNIQVSFDENLNKPIVSVPKLNEILPLTGSVNLFDRGVSIRIENTKSGGHATKSIGSLFSPEYPTSYHITIITGVVRGVFYLME